MTIDQLLTLSGMTAEDVSGYLDDIAENLSREYFIRRERKYYSVATATAGASVTYTYVKFADNNPVLFNAVATKSPDADIVISGNGVLTETSPAETELFAYAAHGNGIVLQDDGETKTFSTIVSSRSAATINSEIVRELKSFLFALKSSDADGVFESIRRLSAAKRNIPAENTMTRQPEKIQTLTITPYGL